MTHVEATETQLPDDDAARAEFLAAQARLTRDTLRADAQAAVENAKRARQKASDAVDAACEAVDAAQAALDKLEG